MPRLLAAAASHTATLINVADLAAPLELTRQTVHDYVTLLERVFLLERLPAAPHIGICHGDYQWANLFYTDERLVAVLDWELWGVGAMLTDLGWILLFADDAAWAHEGRGPSRLPAPAQLQAMYADAFGAAVEDVAWYRALAAYKFSIITGFNLMLHRRGKRHDPYWEILRPSASRLLERALELLAGRP